MHNITTWHAIDGVATNDPDEIIDAALSGRHVERIPPPPSECGCPRCSWAFEDGTTELPAYDLPEWRGDPEEVPV